MHQQPARPAARVASPASMPQTNPTRAAAPLSSPTTENAPTLGPSAEAVKKLDQIVQVRPFAAPRYGEDAVEKC